MAGVLPANVSYFMSRLQGVSVSHYKIFPQTNQTAGANKIIRFDLPSNSLVNLRSLRMLFSAGMTTNGGRLPNKIDSLIARISIFCGGVLVANNFDNYNVLRHAKDALMGDRCDAATGHPEIVRSKSYHNALGADNAVLTAANAAEDYRASGNKGVGRDQFVIDYWESFLGSLEPGIIDTGLFPQITVEITLAENTVCPSVSNVALPSNAAGTNNFCAANAASPVYELTGINMQVEVLGMATSVLDQIVEQRISSVGYLSLPFKNYFAFQDNHTGTTKFNINSASWDRLWITYRPTAYAANAGPHPVAGYKKAGCFTSSLTNTAIATATEIDIGLPQYDAGGTLDTNKEKYISRFFRFQHQVQGGALTTETNFSLQVNGASIPSFKMSPTEFYAVTKNSIDSYHMNKVMTMNQYLDSYFVQAMRFSLPDSDFGRLASGLDTRSTSANVTLETTNLLTAGVTVNIFCECTSELRVGSGRAIEVIQ
tara:strand:+ start:1388 stop:2839 length:1452 start_codon:yes stop_codon:yes gene_type:complete